ncbi:hypothetical protein NMG60_11006110 [Bertholletia excelsa]
MGPSWIYSTRPGCVPANGKSFAARTPLKKTPILFHGCCDSLVLISVFSVFSIVVFLCGSHKTAKSHTRKEERKVRLSEEEVSSAGLQSRSIVKTTSWRKVQGEDEDEGGLEGEEAVWRRNIIMGEKCRPLDFSGKILYDSDGNLLPTATQERGRSSKS